MIRTFLAIHPSPDVLDALRTLQEEVGDLGGSLRWLPTDSLHLTIHFLGDVRESEMPGIERSLAESLLEQPAFDVECKGLGVFPNLKKPRILWAGLQGDGLAALAERAEIALAPLGFPPADREFRPHVTIGRVRSPRGLESLPSILRASAERSFGTSRIEHAVLYKSDLRPTGSVYTPLVTLGFAPSRER